MRRDTKLGILILPIVNGSQNIRHTGIPILVSQYRSSRDPNRDTKLGILILGTLYMDLNICRRSRDSNARILIVGSLQEDINTRILILGS